MWKCQLEFTSNKTVIFSDTVHCNIVVIQTLSDYSNSVKFFYKGVGQICMSVAKL